MDYMDRMPLYSENNVAEGYIVDEEYCTPSQRVEEEDLACTKLVIVEDLAEDESKKIIPMDSMDRMPLVSAPLYQPKNLRTRIRPNKPYGSCTMGSEFKEETKRHKVEMMEDYSLYGDMHAKTDTFLTNVLKKWKGEEFFIHEVNGDRLYKLLDTTTWVDDQSHWFLMVATMKTRKVQVFDSLGKHSELQKIMEWVSEVELARKCIATEILLGKLAEPSDYLLFLKEVVETYCKPTTFTEIRALPTTALPLEVPVGSISFVETYYKPASINTFAGCQ
ncbi:hypothetical protein ACFE04_003385 [Oxalis oulophora]